MVKNTGVRVSGEHKAAALQRTVKYSGDLVFSIAFAFGGLFSAWLGVGRWHGLAWCFCGYLSMVSLVLFFVRKSLEGPSS